MRLARSAFSALSLDIAGGGCFRPFAPLHIRSGYCRRLKHAISRWPISQAAFTRQTGQSVRFSFGSSGNFAARSAAAAPV